MCHGLMNNAHPHTAHFGVFLKWIKQQVPIHSIYIYDYLIQIQHKTKALLLIVRHNTEGPPIPDWP